MNTRPAAKRGRTGEAVRLCTVEIITRMLEGNFSGATYEVNRLQAFAEYTGALVSDNSFGSVPELPIAGIFASAERTPQRLVWLELRAAEGSPRLTIPKELTSSRIKRSLRPLNIEDSPDQPIIRFQIA